MSTPCSPLLFVVFRKPSIHLSLPLYLSRNRSRVDFLTEDELPRCREIDCQRLNMALGFTFFAEDKGKVKTWIALCNDGGHYINTPPPFSKHYINEDNRSHHPQTSLSQNKKAHYNNNERKTGNVVGDNLPHICKPLVCELETHMISPLPPHEIILCYACALVNINFTFSAISLKLKIPYRQPSIQHTLLHIST